VEAATAGSADAVYNHHPAAETPLKTAEVFRRRFLTLKFLKNRCHFLSNKLF
jgi:hypothetical protein